MLMANVDADGSLNNDNFLRTMLTQRNTPDADCKQSPSQIILSHPLRDTLSFSKNWEKFSYSKMSQRCKESWKVKGSVVYIVEGRMDEESIGRGTMESWKVEIVENRLENIIGLI